MLPEVETYEEHYLKDDPEDTFAHDAIFYDDNDATNLENTRHEKSIDKDKATPEDWLDNFYTNKIVSKRAKIQTSSITTDLVDTREFESEIESVADTDDEFQIINPLPETDFNTMNVFHPQDPNNVEEMLSILEDENIDITVKEHDDETAFKLHENEEIQQKFETSTTTLAPTEVSEDSRESGMIAEKLESVTAISTTPLNTVNNKIEKVIKLPEDKAPQNEVFEGSPFEEDFKLIPNFGLSIKRPKERIQRMMLRILQQDPLIFQQKLNNQPGLLERSSRQLDVRMPAPTAPTMFEIPEEFRSFLRRSPHWVKTDYW